MSERFPGGFITKTPPSPTKASASGVWTVEQALTNQQAGTWPYLGPTYVEDVFSTALYTGNGGTQAITNGIDLSTYGGMVITKARSIAYGNILVDTTRGVSNILQTSTTNAQIAESTAVTGVSTTGFSVGSYSNTNGNGQTFASWTFRKQPKFFDVVTWTGNNVNGRVIPHSLDAEVGFIAVKAITTSANDNNWVCRHRSQTSPDRLYLNTTAAASGSTNLAPTTTGFTVYANGYNETGVQYVAYLFAHDAGGFGLTGTDNVISCGSFTTNGSTVATVNIGYEPQWVMAKRVDSSTEGDWLISDVNRRWVVAGGRESFLAANLATQEGQDSGAGVYSNSDSWEPNSTGFRVYGYPFNPSATYIYIAIRRGPMKVPTSGTSVFLPSISSSPNVTFSTGFNVDMFFTTIRAGWARQAMFVDRLRGATRSLESLNTSAESTAISSSNLSISNGYYNSGVSAPLVSLALSRAPKFFDVVTYTGTGGAQTISHNLGAAPELIFEKCRNNLSSAQPWNVYAASQGATKATQLNSTGPFTSQTIWNNTSPTSSVFSINGGDHPSGNTYVAYLFATCPGVSKVGSYSGTGSTINIDCGFTGGARFVLIRRSNSTGGDWWFWDTARGMVSGTSPYSLLNSSLGENNSAHVYTIAGGFQIVSTASDVNVTGGSYIYLAIA